MLLTNSPDYAHLRNRYYLMRHGDSEANRSDIIVSCPEVGITQYGLTGVGVEQVTRAAYRTRLGPDTVVISSDFLRARETAEIFSKVIASHTPVQLATELRERYFGEWDGHDAKHYHAIWSQDSDPLQDDHHGVENVVAVQQRFLRFIAHLETQYQGRQILLVSHGDVLQIGLTHFKNVSPRQHRLLIPIRTAEIRLLTCSLDNTVNVDPALLGYQRSEMALLDS